MPDIKLLNKKIYDLIAAGEVITNPFCVVKELNDSCHIVVFNFLQNKK